MSKKQTIHNEAFRREAVQLLETSGKSVSELARELGIKAWMSEKSRRVFTSYPVCGCVSHIDQAALDGERYC